MLDSSRNGHRLIEDVHSLSVGVIGHLEGALDCARVLPVGARIIDVIIISLYMLLRQIRAICMQRLLCQYY